MDPATVQLRLTKSFNGNIVDLLTDIEQLIVEPDQVARVVIDEQTGTIVMGRDVKVSKVAVAQGNLTLLVTEAPLVSQPTPFSEGETEVVPRTTIEVDDPTDAKLPRDMITILQSIKAAGALQAEIEVL